MKKIIFAFTLMQVMLFADVNLNYKTCANCHGQDGEKAALNGKSKIINQMTKDEFIASMKGYKDGTYGGPMKSLMKAQVMKLNDKDIEDLANKIIK